MAAVSAAGPPPWRLGSEPLRRTLPEAISCTLNKRGTGAAQPSDTRPLAIMKTGLPLADELSAVYARLAELLATEETVGTALRVVTSLAKATIPHSVGAGVTLIDECGTRASAASSDAMVTDADRVQYDLAQGPCLTAWADRVLIRIDDTAIELRWRAWCVHAAASGVRSVLSAPMLTGGARLGAIKVYSDQPRAFDESSEQLLGVFAAQAAILIAAVSSGERARRLGETLQSALRARDAVGTAKGIVMVRDRLDEDAAFAALVADAERSRRTLAAVAETVVRSATR